MDVFVPKNILSEDPDPFFWVCPRFETHRQNMLTELQEIGIIDVNQAMITKNQRNNLIIHGNHNLSVLVNRSMFNIVEKIITNSQRFS